MQDSKRFTRTIENFSCEQCGFSVHGSGYTNHCPKCLYSKHVDVNPGDRAESCGGLMEPVGFFTRHGQSYITHRCIKCGYERNNSVGDNDNQDTLIALASRF